MPMGPSHLFDQHVVNINFQVVSPGSAFNKKWLEQRLTELMLREFAASGLAVAGLGINVNLMEQPK